VVFEIFEISWLKDLRLSKIKGWKCTPTTPPPSPPPTYFNILNV